MGTIILGVSGRRRASRRAIGAGRLEFGERVVERLDVEIASPAPTYIREATEGGAGTERSEDVKYVLLIYDNPEAREAFFGDGPTS